MLLKILILLSSIQLTISLSKPFYDLNNAEEIFKWFLIAYGRKYSTKQEEQIRFQNFVNTLQEINFLNAANTDAVFGINKFADLSKAEFLQTHMGILQNRLYSYKNSDDEACTTFYDGNITTNYAPPKFDWRDNNKVTSVRDQGQCGSCWAFSIIGNVESQYAILKNKLLDFSEQELVDCMVDSDGCDGGLTLVTMYNLKSLGIETEADYPYTAKAQNCEFDKSKVEVQIASCKNYDLKDENKIKEVLYNIGPLSIVLDAGVLHTYSKGVIDYCTGKRQNHAALLVGYGTETGKDYWLMKNSWGVEWGEMGYFKLQRGMDACGFVNDQIGSVVIQV